MNFLQSQEWFNTKLELGNNCYQVGNYFFQTTRIPILNKFVGYMPRVDITKIDIKDLLIKAEMADCVFVAIDPENLKKDINSVEFFKQKAINSALGIPVHLQNTLVLNSEKSDEEFLSAMKQKTRYNLKLAQKKGLNVVISTEEGEFDVFIDLYLKTLKRQNYSGRSSEYIRTVRANFKNKVFVATAYLNNTPLASWFLIEYDNTLTYVYGGSSEEYKNLMAPYLLVWEVFKFAKDKQIKFIDLFGVKNDLSDGYSRFKAGFGGELIEYADTVDIIIQPNIYTGLKTLQKIRNKTRF
jgi:lipid II:glycine glycyltransferase (peptidoglycan interpeptide bridge formation enzyme)